MKGNRMKSDKLVQVFQLMLERAKVNPPEGGFVFAVPGNLASPDTLSEDEARLFDKAGFKWFEQDDGTGSYMVEIAQ